MFICKNCGEMCNPIKKKKGSTLIEIILWLFFMIPGIFYSIWRRTSRDSICPKCKQSTLIPIDSPNGKVLIGSK